MEFKADVTCNIREVESLDQAAQMRKLRLALNWREIGSLYSISSQMKIANGLKLTPLHPKNSKIDFDELEDLYCQICGRLNEKYASTIYKTATEIKVTEFLQRLKVPYEQQRWIGNRCVDIFLPWIGGNNSLANRKMFGLAIELNGKIHNSQIKMKKDESLGDYLNEISIGVSSIENSDVRLWELLSEIKNYSIKKARLDYRAIKRVNTRVYLETILHHATDSEFNSILTVNPRV